MYHLESYWLWRSPRWWRVTHDASGMCISRRFPSSCIFGDRSGLRTSPYKSSKSSRLSRLTTCLHDTLHKPPLQSISISALYARSSPTMAAQFFFDLLGGPQSQQIMSGADSPSSVSTGGTAASSPVNNVFGAFGAVLGYIGAEAATMLTLERLLWPQRFYSNFRLGTLLPISLLTPMGGPIHKSVCRPWIGCSSMDCSGGPARAICSVLHSSPSRAGRIPCTEMALSMRVSPSLYGIAYGLAP